MKKVFFILASILVIGLATYFPSSTWKDVFIMPFYPEGESVKLTVLPGQSIRSVADSMVDLGLAVDRDNLIRFMVQSGLDRKLKPGIYMLYPGPSWKVVRQMKEKKPDNFVVTIIPGTDLKNYFPVNVVSQDSSSFALAEDELWPRDMLSILPDESGLRSVFLLPETYHLPRNKPRDLVVQASNEWWKSLGSSFISSEDAFKKAIVASLVEMESFKDDEKPKIAGVIYNRLDKGMLLQIDATVVYSWKLKGRDLRRVMHDDLKVDSPYNTYRFKGLPPAPICIPSLTSWKAALSPDSHPYLYYVADGTGGHVFTKSYKEHLKAIKSIRGN